MGFLLFVFFSLISLLLVGSTKCRVSCLILVGNQYLRLLGRQVDKNHIFTFILYPFEGVTFYVLHAALISERFCIGIEVTVGLQI